MNKKNFLKELPEIEKHLYCFKVFFIFDKEKPIKEYTYWNEYYFISLFIKDLSTSLRQKSWIVRNIAFLLLKLKMFNLLVRVALTKQC